MDLLSKLKQDFKGNVHTNEKLLEKYSHDTSIFEIKPQAIIYPETVGQLKKLVKLVSSLKKDFPEISITARSAGTDMSGGAINDSIILDFTKHFHHLKNIDPEGTWVQPGMYYRNFEKHSKAKGYYLPSYPASKNICALGGMVGNNSGGEESLTHGQTVNHVNGLKVILADGEEYLLKPLNKDELKQKLKQNDYEGEIYKKVYNLIEKNYKIIKDSKPKVNKNSTAYFVWDVWDKETFDLTKLFVGSQGTLGLITDISVKLTKYKPYSGLLVLYLNDMKLLPHIINDVAETKPDSFEAFDDKTLRLAIRFIPKFIYILGVFGTIRMGLQFIPNLIRFAFNGLPKYTLLVEYEAENQEEVTQKIKDLHQTLSKYDIRIEEAKTKAQADNYWTIRRESFKLLRENVKDKHAAPFVDDFIIPPSKLVEFLPQLIKILEDHQIQPTMAGHMGDGNFHIIPLMDLKDPKERAKIPVVAELVNKLVVKYHGSISAEHNDGLIRGPFMEMMYGPKMYKIFKEIKTIFDPENIFNPHKKTEATMEYSFSHMRDHF